MTAGFRVQGLEPGFGSGGADGGRARLTALGPQTLVVGGVVQVLGQARVIGLAEAHGVGVGVKEGLEVRGRGRRQPAPNALGQPDGVSRPARGGRLADGVWMRDAELD